MKERIIKAFLLGVCIIPLIGILQFCDNAKPDSEVDSLPNDEKLIQYFDLEKNQGLSGVIAIKRADQDILYYCSGYSDKEREIKNTKSTVFDIGSLTKQFTGAAILKLEMVGKLSVEDSLSKYFPDIPKDKHALTIHHLLTHSAGFPRRIGTDFETLSKEEFLKRAFSVDLLFNPGADYKYSHLGYSLLGILIEQISGISYEQFLRINFFEPSGMKKTGYVLPNWDLSTVANGYRKCENYRKPMDWSWGSEGPYWNLKANAGLLSTAEDLMKWSTVLDGNKILSKEAKKKYLSKHIREGPATSYYSYGWIVTSSTRGTVAFAHEGGNGKFYSDWLNYPQEEVSILVLTNEYRPGMNNRAGNLNMASEIARILFYPHHEPKIQLRTIECYDTLPNNRIGEIAGSFIQMLTSSREEDIENLYSEYFSNYLVNKYSKEEIFRGLRKIQKDAGENCDIYKVAVTDNNYMEIEMRRKSDQVKIDLRLKFDVDDEYKIRRFMYNSNEP